ncbi:hypothetical protein N9T80_00640, partial [bacterium]|nr:hypothetical protein [bacterium]
MKKKSLTLVSILFCAITFAQSVPQGINYQAVARDVAGDVLINHALTVQFSILEGTAISWKETHQDTTNSYGLFTAIIGKGANTGGSSATFDDVDWGAASHSLKVEIDYGNGFIDMGTTDFMSVPYSLYAKKAENADSTDELQSLYISGDTLFISDGNFVILNIECFIAGCADTTACNYDPSVCYNDGSCLTAYGCTNPFAANYDPFATCDNDRCSFCWNANSPQIQLIGITSSYNTATIYGTGDTVAGIAIDSLQSNLSFDNLPVIGGSVNYGFDLTGTIDSSSVQFQVPPAPYQNINFSYVTDSSTYSYWQLDLDPQDLIIFPGYKYEVSDYFMILNTPGCVESLSDTAYSNSSFISFPVNPPSRSQVSTATAYRSMLGGGGQDSFFSNSDLHMQSGTPAIIANAYPKNQYSLKDNIIFFDTTSQYEFYNNSLEYKLINRSTISGDIDLGTDLIGNDLCRFRLSTTASNPVTLTSDYRI